MSRPVRYRARFPGDPDPSAGEGPRLVYSTEYVTLGGFFVAWGDYDLDEWTGLTDADGCDVYEGDIIEHTPRHGEPFVGVVQYVAPTFWLFAVKGPNAEESQWSLGYCVEDGARVIGNTFLNADLLDA